MISIIDPSIEPFFIKIKGTSYEIYKRNEKYETFKGCFKDFQSLLLEVIKLKTLEKEGTFTLEEFLLEYKKQTKIVIDKIPEIKI